MTPLPTCLTCGAAVSLYQMPYHNAWHDALTEMLMRLAANAQGVSVESMRTAMGLE